MFGGTAVELIVKGFCSSDDTEDEDELGAWGVGEDVRDNNEEIAEEEERDVKV